MISLPFLLQVHLHRDKVTWPGAKIQKPGEGMPNYENNKIRGTLYITVDVKFPKKAFSEQDSEGMILFLLCGIIFDLLKLGCVLGGARYTGTLFLVFPPSTSLRYSPFPPSYSSPVTLHPSALPPSSFSFPSSSLFLLPLLSPSPSFSCITSPLHHRCLLFCRSD